MKHPFSDKSEGFYCAQMMRYLTRPSKYQVFFLFCDFLVSHMLSHTTIVLCNRLLIMKQKQLDLKKILLQFGFLPKLRSKYVVDAIVFELQHQSKLCCRVREELFIRSKSISKLSIEYIEKQGTKTKIDDL
jgi:hypothetical protein